MGFDHEEITYENYGKISDVIYRLTPTCIFCLNVRLFHDSERFGRTFYHSEIQYYNEKLDRKIINIKRQADTYLTIEQTKFVNGYKGYIMLRDEDMRDLRQTVLAVEQKVAEFSKLYNKKGNSAALKKVKEPIRFEDLPLGGYIVFEPDLYQTFDGKKEPGVRITLGNPSAVEVVSYRKFSGFIECVMNANIYAYGATVNNYFGRPPAGTNMFDMTKNQGIEDAATGIAGRQIGRKKSFFDNT